MFVSDTRMDLRPWIPGPGSTVGYIPVVHVVRHHSTSQNYCIALPRSALAARGAAGSYCYIMYCTYLPRSAVMRSGRNTLTLVHVALHLPRCGPSTRPMECCISRTVRASVSAQSSLTCVSLTAHCMYMWQMEDWNQIEGPPWMFESFHTGLYVQHCKVSTLIQLVLNCALQVCNQRPPRRPGAYLGPRT